MSDAVRLWWKARSLREQRLLIVMAALAIVVIVWLGMLRPLSDARAEARKRHGDTLVAVAQIEAEAARLKALPARSAASGAPINIVRAEADAIAITPSLVEPDGDGIRVDIPVIGAQALFTLIDRMRARGLSVDTLAARPEAGGSLVVTMRLVQTGGAA
jgi:general secretion pathway protein M